MKLPQDILSNLNLELSRHKNPASLDWQLVRGVWTASERSTTFKVVHDPKLGYVIAESKSHVMGVAVR